MNFEHLRVFYTVARKKNFSETAKALHLSQPTVSSYIRQLEQSVEDVLFERTTKSVELTEAGKVLYRHAAAVLERLQDARRDLDDLKESVHGDVVVGASLTIGAYVLPHILGDFKKAYPQVNIIMRTFNSEQIAQQLDHDELELGFIESMMSYPQFTQEAFLEDELVIIASDKLSPLPVEQTTITTDDLFRLPVILRESGSGTRHVIEEHLKHHHLNPKHLNVILELENTESIKSAVEAGMGVSIISKSAVLKELELGTLKQLTIENIQWTRHFYTVYRKDRLTTPAQAFLKHVFETFSHGQIEGDY